MLIHFAGADNAPKYNEILLEKGATSRLESYWSLKSKAPSADFKTLLVDSGGFVARTKGVVISPAKFAAYLNEHKVQLAFNLDTNDVPETLANQKYLEEHSSTYIIPVYHLSDYLENRELLHDFTRDYPYISVGGVAGEGSSTSLQEEFYKYVFYHTRDTVRVHGLGITAKPMLQRFPWYSVDSTSWLSAARFGNTRTTDCDMVAAFYAKHRHYLDNTAREVEWWVILEEFVTNLWTKRGVIWEPFTFTAAKQ